MASGNTVEQADVRAELDREAARFLGSGRAGSREEAEASAVREMALEHRMRILGGRDLRADTAKLFGVPPEEVSDCELRQVNDIMQARIDRLAVGETTATDFLWTEARREAGHRAARRKAAR